MVDQGLILAVLAATVGMFLWGKWRHDMVAMGALLACVAVGLVPATEAFLGFGHPAVITVACVLVLSRGLQVTGVVDAVTARVLPRAAGPTVTIAALTGLAAVLSAFMNNVGALALLMPVAIQVAKKQGMPAGRVLMPLAFGSILGGMTTLIGTPPNLIVSGFRAEAGRTGFGMFDYSPVGVAVAVTGVIFVALIGWRLVPARERAGADDFETGAYMTEVRIKPEGKAAGKALRELGPILAEADAQVVGMVRGTERVSLPGAGRVVRAGDVLVIEAEPGTLGALLERLGLELVEAKKEPKKGEGKEEEGGKSGVEGGEVVVRELAVRPDAWITGRSATDLNLRTRFGVNLLALSRQGRRSVQRLRSERLMAGDVLLLQGAPEAIAGFGVETGCVPLAEREIRIPDKGKAVVAAVVMGLAVAGAAFGLLPAAVAFAGGGVGVDGV